VEVVPLLLTPDEPNGIDPVGPTAEQTGKASLPAGVVSGYIEGMRVVVDFDLCESNALCMAAAPEVFEVRDDDFLYVLMEEPPAELRDKVEAAARACPKVAITIVD
jgi:ferredoxin